MRGTPPASHSETPGWARRLRIAAAIGCLVLLAGLGTANWWPRDSTPGLPSPSSPVAMTNEQCRQCHQEAWDEWRSSMHAVAWTSPNVQAAFQHFGHDRKCESCHAPMPVFVTGLEQPVEFRSSDHAAGVDCVSCHLTADGRVAAVRTMENAPCRPVATAELRSSRHCAVCHVAIYKDWEQSSHATQGKTCQTCHMPPTTPGGARASHLCLGGHDDELVRSAAQLDCAVGGGELVVSVTNSGAGHNFPGERHNRVLLLEVFEYDAGGEIVLGQQHRIKEITPFRGESSAEQIQAGQTIAARFPVIERAVTAEVRLLYKHFPWISDREALVVRRQEVAFE